MTNTHAEEVRARKFAEERAREAAKAAMQTPAYNVDAIRAMTDQDLWYTAISQGLTTDQYVTREEKFASRKQQEAELAAQEAAVHIF